VADFRGKLFATKIYSNQSIDNESENEVICRPNKYSIKANYAWVGNLIQSTADAFKNLGIGENLHKITIKATAGWL